MNIKEILELHAQWLENSEEGERADLQDTNLQGANLQGANLERAGLQGVYLKGADLQGANLRHADLQHADLQSANLRYADLQGANLEDADLEDAFIKNIILTECLGLKYAYCSWSDHGECGRKLQAVVINGEIRFSCGCVNRYTKQELLKYIDVGLNKYKESRLKAMNFLLSCLE